MRLKTSNKEVPPVLFILKGKPLRIVFSTHAIHCVASCDICDLCCKLEFDIVVTALSKEICPRGLKIGFKAPIPWLHFIFLLYVLLLFIYFPPNECKFLISPCGNNTKPF